MSKTQHTIYYITAPQMIGEDMQAMRKDLSERKGGYMPPFMSFADDGSGEGFEQFKRHLCKQLDALWESHQKFNRK